MKKKAVIATIGKLACTVSLAAMLGGCTGKDAPAEQDKPAVTIDPAGSEEPIATIAPESPEEPENKPEETPEETPDTEVTGGRKDGERFEDTIMLEGMEETVNYEHVKNETIGFELDYEYDSLARSADSGRECFTSLYDLPHSPENYLEVAYSPDDAETAAEALTKKLSNEYDVRKEILKLDNAGDCIVLDATSAKGGDIAKQMQRVYIISAPDGCRVATAHFSFEAAEGFGSRFGFMVNTMTVIDRTGDGRLSDEDVYSAIVNYCHDNYPDLDKIIADGEYPLYWEIESTSDKETVILFRSYTGAQVRYYVDPYSGDTYVTEYVPGITPDEEKSEDSLNVRYYLGSI